MMQKRLENRVAVVTGAAQGLGEAIARRMADEGCLGVVLADMNLEKTQAAAEKIAAETGTRTLAVQTNVTDEAQVAALIDQTVATFGSLDILIANAGILKAHDVLEFPADEWRAVIEVNLIGYFLCAKEAARVMKEQQARSHRSDQLKVGQKRQFPQQCVFGKQIRRHRTDSKHCPRSRAFRDSGQCGLSGKSA